MKILPSSLSSVEKHVNQKIDSRNHVPAADKLVAVHATNLLPDGDVALPPLAPPRYATYFSLNTLISPATDASKKVIQWSWEGRKYAILVPLLGLPKAQVATIGPYETVVLGSVRLPRDAIILAPRGDAAAAASSLGTQIKSYQGTLREGVEGALRMLGVPVMQLGTLTSGMAKKPVATVEGDTIDINTPEAFAGILSKFPSASFHQEYIEKPSLSEALRILDHIAKFPGLLANPVWSKLNTHAAQEVRQYMTDSQGTIDEKVTTALTACLKATIIGQADYEKSASESYDSDDSDDSEESEDYPIDIYRAGELVYITALASFVCEATLLKAATASGCEDFGPLFITLWAAARQLAKQISQPNQPVQSFLPYWNNVKPTDKPLYAVCVLNLLTAEWHLGRELPQAKHLLDVIQKHLSSDLQDIGSLKLPDRLHKVMLTFDPPAYP